MAERTADAVFSQEYRGAVPSLDRRTHPSRVQAGSYPRLWGIDGRFEGAFRRFPGFRSVLELLYGETNRAWQAGSSGSFNDTSITTAWGKIGWFQETEASGPYYYLPSIWNNHPSLTFEVWFFKYLSIRTVDNPKSYPDVLATGATETSVVLRGFVVAHNYWDVAAGAAKGVLRFYYYDPTYSMWVYHDLLKQVTALPTTPVTDVEYPFRGFMSTDSSYFGATVEYDVTSLGPFIYFTARQATGGGALTRSVLVQGRGVGSKTDTTDFDSFGGGLSAGHKHISLWAPTPMAIQANLAFTGTPTAVAGGNGKLTNNAKVSATIAVELRGKGLISPLSPNTEGEQNSGAVGYLNYAIATGSSYLSGHFDGCNWWALVPRLRIFRTLESTVLGSGNEMILNAAGRMFEDKDRDGSGNVTERKFDLTGTNPGVSIAGPHALTAVYVVTGAAVRPVGEQSDITVTGNRELQVFRDDAAFAADGVSRLLAYQNTLLRVGKVPRLGPRFEGEHVDRDQILSWGSLSPDRFAPEQWRAVDTTPLGNKQDETILGLVSAGDYCFAIGDTSIFRIQRSGAVMGINEVQSLVGGVSRFAAVGLYARLYYVSPTGLYLVDGATGESALVSVMDRIVLEDWRASLTSIRMAHDSFMGALMVYNSTAREMAIIWGNTGIVTQLKQCGFVFGDSGVDPVTYDFNRSWWITAGGGIVTPNAERKSGYATSMCAHASSSSWEWNVAVAVVESATSIIVEASSVHTSQGTGELGQFRGMGIGALTGTERGAIRKLTTITDIGAGSTGRLYRIVIGEGGFAALAAGDKVSLAPVAFEVVGWPQQDERAGQEVFRHKVMTQIGAATILLGGDTGNADHTRMVYTAYQNGDLETSLNTTLPDAPMVTDPTSSYAQLASGGIGGQILYPVWRQLASNVDFEWLGGMVKGILSASEAMSNPGAAY